MHVHLYFCCVNLKHIHTHTTQQSGKRSVALLTFSQTITPTYTYICAYLHICSLSFTLVFLLRQSQTYQNKQRKKVAWEAALSAHAAPILREVRGGRGGAVPATSYQAIASTRACRFFAQVCVSLLLGGKHD